MNELWLVALKSDIDTKLKAVWPKDSQASGPNVACPSFSYVDAGSDGSYTLHVSQTLAFAPTIKFEIDISRNQLSFFHGDHALVTGYARGMLLLVYRRMMERIDELCKNMKETGKWTKQEQP